jgi:hypothetical protein
MCSLVLAAGVAATADAALGQATLSARMTADNLFTAYISTDPNSAGTEFLSGNSWPTTFTGSTVITEPGTYYLHVLATDQGRPEMFIADVDLGSFGPGWSASFANSTTALLSNTSDWRVSNTGFGQNYVAPLDLGSNASGGGVWGVRPSISGDARFLWAPQFTSTVYFATTFTVVPGPAAAGLLGLGGLVIARRRRA